MACTGVSLWLLPRFIPRCFANLGGRVSEPEIKFLLLVLFLLGGLGSSARSEAVLPAYLVGLVLAPYFVNYREVAQRLRMIAFGILTPFYFLKARSLVNLAAFLAGTGLIATLLAIKMVTKFVGIWPLTRAFRFTPSEGMYTTCPASAPVGHFDVISEGRISGSS